MRKGVLGIGLAILLLIVSSCGTDPEVQLAEFSRNTVVYDEIVRLNNCGGKGDSDHTATREFATTIDIAGGASLKSVVEGTISAKYSEYRNTSKSLRVVAPPGTNMEFVLRWSDDVRAGNVQVNGKSGTYEVRIPISVEQISSRDLGCGLDIPVQPTSPPALQYQNSTPASSVTCKLDFLGEWVYQQPRAPMPSPAGPNQVIFAHGDIDNSGTCHVKEFGPGEPVQGLGLGSFKLWLITGSPECIRDYETYLQQGAAAHAGTDCPYLP